MIFWRTLPYTLICCVLCQCSHSPPAHASGFNGVDGPFDSNGNYVEAWADDSPAKVKKKKKKATKKKKKTSTTRAHKKEIKAPKKSLPSKKPSSSTSQSKPKPKITPKPKPKATTKSRPKPKAKVKAQPKPPVKKPISRSRSHTVVKGNTLYSLSRQYGVSVAEIQKANKLSGSTIKLGQVLKIPQK